VSIRNYFHNFLWIIYWNKTPFSCYEVLPYLLLLYKHLPSKVKLLRLILNVYFIGFQLFSEGKLYSSTSLIFKYCISYRSHPDSRRNIRDHPGTRRGFLWSSGQCCWTNGSSELWFWRPKVHWLHRHLWRQAPVHNPSILNYATYYYILVHLNY
jgi:hypothetical protein